MFQTMLNRIFHRKSSADRKVEEILGTVYDKTAKVGERARELDATIKKTVSYDIARAMGIVRRK